MNKVQFTQEGYKNLQNELEELQKIRRPAAVDRLAKARAMGDLSENSEYSAAKEELAFVEGRVREIEDLVKKAEIIDTKATDGINLGNEVTVEKEGKKETYTIVGEFEADPLKRRLSATSPIGKALLGKKEGEIVSVDVPAGKLNYKVLQIKK